MPIELGVWRIDDNELSRVNIGALEQEKRLEDFLDQDISIASPNWMVVGRQVPTDYGKFIDLLAIDRDGRLIVLELKRDKTPREVVAQLLDYGSWVRNLKDEAIAKIYEEYRQKFHPDWPDQSLDDAYQARFGLKEMPEELNSGHELVVVASELDDSTERIVTYLFEEYGVAINAIFFRIFRDRDREYLSSVWFIDPMEEAPAAKQHSEKEPWNGEYYVSFGHRDYWEEARKYGFISAGGGAWYSKTLGMLEPGVRIWVNIPGGIGYVGVGHVVECSVPIDDFMVDDDKGNRVPITTLGLNVGKMCSKAEDPERAEYMVRVKWIQTVSESEAIREKGFFGNQNSAAKPRAKKWQHTVDRLKKRFGVH